MVVWTTVQPELDTAVHSQQLKNCVAAVGTVNYTLSL